MPFEKRICKQFREDGELKQHLQPKLGIQFGLIECNLRQTSKERKMCSIIGVGNCSFAENGNAWQANSYTRKFKILHMRTHLNLSSKNIKLQTRLQIFSAMNEKYTYLLQSFSLIKMCSVYYILISILWNPFYELHFNWSSSWSYLLAQRVETYLNLLFCNNNEKVLSTSWWNAIFLGFLFQHRQFSFAPNPVLISARSFAQ